MGYVPCALIELQNLLQWQQRRMSTPTFFVKWVGPWSLSCGYNGLMVRWLAEACRIAHHTRCSQKRNTTASLDSHTDSQEHGSTVDMAEDCLRVRRVASCSNQAGVAQYQRADELIAPVSRVSCANFAEK